MVYKLPSHITIFICSKLRFTDRHQTSKSSAVPNYGLQTDINLHNLHLFQTTVYRLSSNVTLFSCSILRFTDWHQTLQTSAVQNYGLHTAIKCLNLQLFETTIYRLTSNVTIFSSSTRRFQYSDIKHHSPQQCHTPAQTCVLDRLDFRLHRDLHVQFQYPTSICTNDWNRRGYCRTRGIKVIDLHCSVTTVAFSSIGR